MNFTPLSEKELQEAALLPEGMYQYQVIKAEEKVSKAGNDYIAIQLKVWDAEGKEHIVFTNMALIKLLKHFCDVNNMENEYLSGRVLADQMLYKSGGMVMIKVEPEKPNPTGGMYRAKNTVFDYISSPHGSTMKPLPEVDKFKDSSLDEDLPF